MSWGPIIGAGISLLGSMYAKNGKMDTVSNETLGAEYADFKANLDRQNRLSEQLIDPESAYNLSQSQRIKNMGYDNLALGNMLNQRNFAQGGAGGYSGILGQQQRAATAKTESDMQDRIQNMVANNFQLGLGGLQKTGTGYQQYGDIMGQNLLNNQAIQNQMSQAKAQMGYQGLLGLGQGIMYHGLLNEDEN